MRISKVIVAFAVTLGVLLAFRLLMHRDDSADASAVKTPGGLAVTGQNAQQTSRGESIKEHARQKSGATRERFENPEGQEGAVGGKQPVDWHDALKRALQSPDNAQLLSLLSPDGWGNDATKRGEMLLEAARLLAMIDPERGAKLLDEMKELNDRLLLVSHLTRALLESDSKKAADWVAQLKDAAVAGQAHEVLARDWAGKDLDGALNWIEGLGDARNQVKAAEGLMWTWAQHDIDGAVEWAMELPDSEFRDAVFLKTSKILATQDPAIASEWAAKFPEGKGRDSAFNYAVFQWAERDVAAAGSWVQTLEDPDLQKVALGAITGAWANREPDKAAEWLLQLPLETRADALPAVASKWAARDAAAAVAWVNALPDAGERNRLLTYLNKPVPRN